MLVPPATGLSVPFVGLVAMRTSGDPVPVPPVQSMKIGVAALCGTLTAMSLHVGAAPSAVAGPTTSASGASTAAVHFHRARLITRRRSQIRPGPSQAPTGYGPSRNGGYWSVAMITA